MVEIATYERHEVKPPALYSRSSPLYLAGSEGSGLPAVPTYKPCHYFDYICGSDMGGLFAVMLGVQQVTVKEAIRLAESIVCKGIEPVKPPRKLAFGLRRARSRNSRNLSRALKSLPSDWERCLGSEEGSCRTVVFATHRASKEVQRPFALRSYDQRGTRVRNENSNTRVISLVDASRASLSGANFDAVKISNLPGTFSVAKFSHTDSALEAYHEVRSIHGNRVEFLLSIGRTPNILRDNYMRELSKEHGFDYWGIVDRSDPGAANIGEIRERAWNFCQGFREGLKSWAKKLVLSRRQRAMTAQWNVFANLRMRCPLCPTAEASSRVFDVSALERHYVMKHAGVQKLGATGERLGLVDLC